MDRFAAMRTFSRVVEAGSFARAAEQLGLSTTAASRQVAELEAHLQTRLLNRTTRRLSLTESGRAFYARAVHLLDDLEEAEKEAARAAVEPVGTIRLTTSVAFGIRHVAPVIAAFQARHPAVRFDVSVSDRIVDLVEEAFDVAVRIGAHGSDQLAARKLGETQLLVGASPAYLAARGVPRTPADLAAHDCLTYEYDSARVWRFHDAAGQEHAVHISGPLHANSGDLLVEAAAQGAGITFERDFVVGPEVRAGRLVALLQDYRTPRLPIYVVYPSRKHLSAKVRAFVDFIAQRFADVPGGPGFEIGI